MTEIYLFALCATVTAFALGFFVGVLVEANANKAHRIESLERRVRRAQTNEG